MPTIEDVLMGSNGGAGTPEPQEMEKAIARIPGIQAVRVVTSGERVSEVHVLAGRARGPKQLVRDVQSVVLTNFGVEIDYRTVSVVQLEEEPPNGDAVPTGEKKASVETPRRPRAALSRIASETTGFDSDIRISLRVDEAETEGVARGPATSGLRLVAQAVIDALKDRLDASSVEVEFADVVMAGQRQVAIAVLRLLTGRGDHVVVGSAVLRRDPSDAMAKAALDAVNRLVFAD
ncbi:MAG: hypothetical protein ABR548_11330 [Actinomycetota bacterium]|nr:hypothetical protein [Actinomycetota bacterium]